MIFITSSSHIAHLQIFSFKHRSEAASSVFSTWEDGILGTLHCCWLCRDLIYLQVKSLVRRVLSLRCCVRDVLRPEFPPSNNDQICGAKLWIAALSVFRSRSFYKNANLLLRCLARSGSDLPSGQSGDNKQNKSCHNKNIRFHNNNKNFHKTTLRLHSFFFSNQ